MYPKISPRLTLALFLILIGILLLFDRLGFFGFAHVIRTWWPLILIYFGIRKFLIARRYGGTSGMGLLVSGVLLQLLMLNVFRADMWRTYWPIILILVGLWFVIETFVKKSEAEAEPEPIGGVMPDVRNDGFVESSNFFSSSNEVYQARPLIGGNITAFFGGTKINLRDSDINLPVRIDVTVFFSGVELYVPPDWKVLYAVTPVFSSMEDKRFGIAANPQKELRISGIVAFGSIEIKN
jgi:hypothetical protein